MRRRTLIDQAWNLIQNKDYVGALKLLDSATPKNNSRKFPIWADAKGRCLQGLNQHDLAILFFKSANNYVSLAYCYIELKDFKNACLAFEKIPLVRLRRHVLIDWAFCHLYMGEYEKALTLFKDLDPRHNNPVVILGLARTYDEMNALDNARKMYDNLISKHPNFYQLHFYRCRFLIKIADPNAMVELDRAIKKYPDDAALIKLRTLSFPEDVDMVRLESRISIKDRFFKQIKHGEFKLPESQDQLAALDLPGYTARKR